MQELDDNVLLREYVEHDSEEAFAALITRHVNKVYSVALRLTGNPHSAEEITQAVFVILARKSQHLGKRVILSGWLYQTARLTAVTFIRGGIRRARREQEACMQTALNENESDAWMQIAPLLDAAMAGLNETDRHAVVLRFFDGKSLREVGAALGANEEAAKKRVSRALEKLRTFFAKRGVSSTTAIIAGAISANSVQAAPAALAKAVTVIAVAKGATAGGSTLTLIKGALKIMAWTKAKTAIVISAGLILTAGIATVAVKAFIPSITMKDAYVKLYADPDYGGEMLTILPWEAPSNDVAVRGDVENFDGLPPDSRDPVSFNDKASSAIYLLPKGCTVILFEHARFDGQQYKLVGTGKVEAIPDFKITHPAFDGITSSLRWIGTATFPVNEIGQKRAQSPKLVDDFEKKMRQTPGDALTLEAVKFLVTLKKLDQLPGLPKDEHKSPIMIQNWSQDSHGVWYFSRTNGETYPVFRTIRASKNNDGLWAYFYTVVKASVTNDWQLQKAWRTDTNGQVVEEYHVP